MSSSTIGAKTIDVQNFSCEIREISCVIVKDKDKTEKNTLFSRNKPSKALPAENTVAMQQSVDEGTLYCGVTNYSESRDYYFISNYRGKDIEFKCEREVNQCTEELHETYTIDYTDIDTRELRSERHHITDGKHKLYYYNIFNRAGDYSKAAAQFVFDRTTTEHPLIRAGQTATAYATGAVAGHVMDAVCALRFILLPTISQKDYKYECHAVLDYMECPHSPGVPSIVINIYPDIEFSFEIGFLGKELKYSKGNKEKETTPFSFDFSVEYADTKYELSIADTDEAELSDEEKKGNLFYKSILWLAGFLKGAASFAENLKKEIDQIYGESDLSIASDIGKMGKGLKATGGVLAQATDWLEGSFEFSPALSGKWRYCVRKKMAELGRHLELELGVSAKGKLTINMVKLGSLVLNKGKNVTTVVAGTAAVVSGGLAALPALLIKFLIDTVLQWLLKKLQEGFKFNIIISAGIDSPNISYDSEREQAFEIGKLTVSPGIKLELGLDYKTSLSLTMEIDKDKDKDKDKNNDAEKKKKSLIPIKFEANAKAMLESEASLDWEFSVNKRTGVLGVDIETTIKPFTIKIYYEIGAGFEIFIVSGSVSHNGDVAQWETQEYKLDPARINFFKTEEEKTGGTTGGGKNGRRRGGGSWGNGSTGNGAAGGGGSSWGNGSAENGAAGGGGSSW